MLSLCVLMICRCALYSFMICFAMLKYIYHSETSPHRRDRDVLVSINQARVCTLTYPSGWGEASVCVGLEVRPPIMRFLSCQLGSVTARDETHYTQGPSYTIKKSVLRTERALRRLGGVTGSDTHTVRRKGVLTVVDQPRVLRFLSFAPS